VDWSPDGRRLVVERHGRLYVVGADGRHERLLTAGNSPSWAPKSGQIAFIRKADAYVIESSGHGLRRITSSGAVDGEPAWSPDGKRLALVSTDGPGTDLYVADVRTKALLRLTQDPVVERSPGWSRDGGRIIYLGDTRRRRNVARRSTRGHRFSPAPGAVAGVAA
jgi:TolB protein